MSFKIIKKTLIEKLEAYQHRIEQSVNTGNEDGEILQQSPRWMRYTTWGLMATTGIGITCMCTEEVVVAQGKLEPVGGVREIQIPVNGVVQTLDVEEEKESKLDRCFLLLTQKQRLRTRVLWNLEYTHQLRLKKDERNEYLKQ